tara:strand:+ start:62 stop:268 length:207 start_codon:yes stop_codon:yes gene_type:complete
MDQHLIVLEVLEVQHKVVAVQETLPQLVLPKEIMQVPVEQHHNTLVVEAVEPVQQEERNLEVQVEKVG